MSADPDLLDRALATARRAALQAAEAIMPWFGKAGLAVEEKQDASPVTEADRAAERVIREGIAAAFPDHSIWGEEYGGQAEARGWQWLVDPLDGTKSFVRGNPVFSTQIALWHDGVPMLGLSHVPATGESAWAVRGRGAYIDGVPVRCRPVTAIERAAVSTGNLKTLAGSRQGWAGLARIAAEAWRLRGYGDYLHYHLLARGGVDAVVESDVHVLDIAALCLIIAEAGGRFTDLDGGPVRADTRSVLAAATDDLHAELMARLHVT